MNFIDKVYYINLEKSVERKEHIEKELSRYGLEFERINAIEHSEGIIGCGKSHLMALKKAKENGYKNCLIFEDDFFFIVDKQTFELNITKFFTSNIEYDVCMLSYLLLNHEKVDEFPFLYKVISAQTTSGYLVNCQYYDKLIEIWEYGLLHLEQTYRHWDYAVDQIWKKLQSKDKWFAFTERIGKQKPGYSFISKTIVNHDC